MFRLRTRSAINKNAPFNTPIITGTRVTNTPVQKSGTPAERMPSTKPDPARRPTPVKKNKSPNSIRIKRAAAGTRPNSGFRIRSHPTTKPATNKPPAEPMPSGIPPNLTVT